MAKRAVTLREVAIRAGVSVATASHALNNTRGVGVSVRSRVETAATELGYHPNILARGLKTGSSKLVTCIVSSLSNPLISAAVEGAHSILQQHGYGMLVFRSGPNVDDVSAGTEFAASYHSAGLLVIHPLAEGSDQLQRWVRSRKPISFAIHRQPSMEADHVLMGDEDAGYQATRHLIEHGHRRIGLLVRSLAMEVYSAVAKGYARALAESDIPFAEQFVSEKSATGLTSTAQSLGYAETRKLLALPIRPTAFLCAHNQIAIGSLRALQEADIALPQQMSLISFDRVDWMEITRPKITSIGIDGEIIGQTAAAQLLNRIAGETHGVLNTLLTLRLFPGESVSAPATPTSR